MKFSSYFAAACLGFLCGYLVPSNCSVISENNLDTYDMIDVQNITKKISSHVDLLNKFNTKNKKFKLITVKKNYFSFVDSTLVFHHEQIRLCLKQLLQATNLDPLFLTWNTFLKDFNAVDNQLFVKEFSILIFSVYKNIFSYFLQMDHKKFSGALLEEIITLYHQISKLPIKEILTILDTCFDIMQDILNQYEWNASLSWGDWLKKYWWLPPVVVFGIVLSVLNNFSSEQGGYNPFI